MSKYFKSTDILLPKETPMESWAVIACDQFTSDHAYWKRVRMNAEGHPSTLNMILPEAELASSNDATIDEINASMRKYLAENVFSTYPNCYVYIERTLVSGAIRQGMVGVVDLEHYHYDPSVHPKICATEMTVLERIPPRVAVRKDAELEFSHVLLLCEDPEFTLIEQVAAKKAQLPKLYEFDLMEGGGHIAAWLVSGDDASAFDAALDLYEAQNTYLVGDGNHSLVTAKTIYDQLKNKLPEDEVATHPARYAMVELENVHSDAMVFEPIHRVLFNTDAVKLLKDMDAICAPTGTCVTWFSGDASGKIYIDTPKGELTVGVVQDFLDDWMKSNSAEIDYIHGDAVAQLAKTENAIGFLLPTMDKSDLFPFVQGGRTLPRKTFSMGHGCEKRYYLEGRKIK